MIPTVPHKAPSHLDVPESLNKLVDLAYNMWWTWNREAQELFTRVHADHWTRYRNPVRVLLMTRRSRLEHVAADEVFMADLDRVWDRLHTEAEHPVSDRLVTYVSAEFALHESLPIYSGGLGVLSADHLKEASDMGLPLLAVGLFYRRGYFHQLVDADGYQQHFYPDLDALRLPLLKVSDREGNTLRVPVEMNGRQVVLRAWLAQVGRVPLILLDSFSSHNPPEDRYITSQLYVRGREMRLEQEVVLGRGAVAVLQALDIEPDTWHMNEGHSVFLALDNLKKCKSESLPATVAAARPRHVFTTHTPVPAGNEVFKREDVRPYLTKLAGELSCTEDELLALGENGSPDFNMTALALRLSHRANGVSKLHAEVSRHMWPEHDIRPITNGVHMASWLGREVSKVLGAKETTPPDVVAQSAAEAAPQAIWAAHMAQKHRLMRFVRVRALRQAARHGQSPAAMRSLENLLNPSTLTLGFARRFASYKRAELLFSDPDRLEKLVCQEHRPVQIIIAGKAHPADRPGQEIIRRIWSLAGREHLRGRIVVTEDYDLAVARLMVRGVDVWLNTPEWGREASGTSGMKAVANGVLHASVPDGWWAEAHGPGRGFDIGEQTAPDDARDARLLLDLIEHEIVPLYYDRDSDGLPRAWIETMKRSMAAFIGQFSTRRMLEQYARDLYALEPVTA